MSTEENSPRAVILTRDVWGTGPSETKIEPNPHVDLNNARNLPRSQTGFPRTEQLPGQPKFNQLHVSHLPQKIDGVTSHLFIAILNGEAVGSALASIHANKSCGLTAVFVKHINRRMGIGTRICKTIETWAKMERAQSLEVAVSRGNTQARQFWIRQRFIDDDSAPNELGPQHVAMTKQL